jgi:hypothetical protein
MQGTWLPDLHRQWGFQKDNGFLPVGRWGIGSRAWDWRRKGDFPLASRGADRNKILSHETDSPEARTVVSKTAIHAVAIGSVLGTTTMAFKNMHRNVEPTSKPGQQEVVSEEHPEEGALPAQDRLVMVEAASLQHEDAGVENVAVGATFAVIPVMLVM